MGMNWNWVRFAKIEFPPKKMRMTHAHEPCAWVIEEY